MQVDYNKTTIVVSVSSRPKSRNRFNWRDNKVTVLLSVCFAVIYWVTSHPEILPYAPLQNVLHNAFRDYTQGHEISHSILTVFPGVWLLFSISIGLVCGRDRRSTLFIMSLCAIAGLGGGTVLYLHLEHFQDPIWEQINRNGQIYTCPWSFLTSFIIGYFRGKGRDEKATSWVISLVVIMVGNLIFEHSGLIEAPSNVMIRIN